ncbi:hypothetical protein FYJ91_11150 [Sphingomonas montanisoli]|uniref:Uncharacterized protein n=2 Tax=Sphingomonas montanisoli TaxID=2606412 RepID=A0A5D9C2U2_9SPHN|nr:hypothetical protein FYJ91_11150 [Sphingomonas montanisoli]
MAGDGAHIRIKLATEEPVALNDFVGSFVGIGSQFDKFVARDHPTIKADSEFFVKEVRAGCIEADLVAWVAPIIGGLPGMSAVDMIDRVQILTSFVSDLQERIGNYFKPGGRDPRATKSDLADYHKAVAAIARDPNASGVIEAAVFESDGREVRSAFRFRSIDAQVAQREIAEHRKEIEARLDENQTRVLLRFVRPSVEASKPGKKGGERGVIESIHKRALPVLYASDLAEQRMHHEKLQLAGNIFRALFDVDVNIEAGVSGRPIAYRIMQVHDVLDDAGDETLDL